MADARAERIRVVLADDHAEVRDEIRHLLRSEFDIVGAVGDTKALLETATDLRPDAVISDVRMPGCGGIAAGEELLRKELCKAVIVLTMYNEPHLVRQARAAGIQGYVLKVDAGEELIAAVYAVLGGTNYLSQGVAESDKKGCGGNHQALY